MHAAYIIYFLHYIISFSFLTNQPFLKSTIFDMDKVNIYSMLTFFFQLFRMYLKSMRMEIMALKKDDKTIIRQVKFPSMLLAGQCSYQFRF